jgi:hypothetical protein
MKNFTFKHFVESDQVDLDKIMKIHKKEFSETAEAINSIEIAQMVEDVSEPSVNLYFLRGLMVMLAHGHSPANPGPYANAIKELYVKQILGNLIKIDRLTQDKFDYIKKQKIKHLEDIGHPRSDYTEVDLKRAHGGVTLDSNYCNYANSFSVDSNGNTELNLIICGYPFEYDEEDKMFLRSIVYHEVRHAYDAYFEGIKSYYGNPQDNMEEYLSSYIEAKAFTAQITDLLFNFINHYGKTITHAKNKIKRYIKKQHQQISPALMDENVGALLLLLIDEVAKRPDLINQRKDLLDLELKEDMRNIPFVKTIDNENEEIYLEKIVNKIEKLFSKIYENIISPKKVFKKYMKRKNILPRQN